MSYSYIKSVYPNFENSKDFNLNQVNTQESSQKETVSPINSNEGNLPYIKEKEAGFAKDIAIETYVPNRTAQLSLANYTVLKARIPGDPGMLAGKTINFNLLTLKPSDTKKDLDKFYSGKYLVTAVRHIIQPNNGTFQTILEIAKDSSAKGYQNPNNNDAVWKDATTSA